MSKKIIAVKSNKTKIIYFIFQLYEINGETLASNSQEPPFKFIPIFEGTTYEEAINL